MQQPSLYSDFDQFVRAFLPMFHPSVTNSWDHFLQLLQAKPLDYTKIYTFINSMNHEDTAPKPEDRQHSSQKNNPLRPLNTTNITAASSPRPIGSKNPISTPISHLNSLAHGSGANNFINKYSQLDNAQSPKLNISSQQQLIHKNSLQTHMRQNNHYQFEDFNRHLLLSKTKELLFTLSVSSDKLNAMAKFPMLNSAKENHPSKSPQQPMNVQHYQVVNQNGYVYQPVVKTRNSNHSAEHYTLQKPII